MSGKVVFGYGCSLHEHTLFGMCLDGMCGRRSQFEQTTLLCNDENRLKGNVSLQGSMAMLEETPAERREKAFQEKLTRVKAIQEQLKGTLDLIAKSDAPPDPLAGHKQAKMLRGLEQESEVDPTPGQLPPREDNDALAKRVKARKSYKTLTPLHIAAHRQDLQAIEHLAQLGYDINDAEQKSGQTAMHIAAAQNNIEAVEFLLSLFGDSLNIGIL